MLNHDQSLTEVEFIAFDLETTGLFPVVNRIVEFGAVRFQIDGRELDTFEQQSVPAMFVPNVFSFATDGKAFRYGSVRMPLDIWGPWRIAPDPGPRDGEPTALAAGHEYAPIPAEEPEASACGSHTDGSLADVRKSVASILRPETVLDILQNFTIFATDKKHRRASRSSAATNSTKAPT